MIQLKPRTKLTLGAHRISPEIFFAISVAENILENYGLVVHIDALLEGHSNHHRLGNEVDITVKPDCAKEIATDLQTALLDSFVVRADGSIVHVVFTNA